MIRRLHWVRGAFRQGRAWHSLCKENAPNIVRLRIDQSMQRTAWKMNENRSHSHRYWAIYGVSYDNAAGNSADSREWSRSSPNWKWYTGALQLSNYAGRNNGNASWTRMLHTRVHSSSIALRKCSRWAAIVRERRSLCAGAATYHWIQRFVSGLPWLRSIWIDWRKWPTKLNDATLLSPRHLMFSSTKLSNCEHCQNQSHMEVCARHCVVQLCVWSSDWTTSPWNVAKSNWAQSAKFRRKTISWIAPVINEIV